MHSICQVLSLCLFMIVLWIWVPAFLGVIVYGALHLVYHQLLSISVLMHSLGLVLCRCLFQTVLLNFVRGAFVGAKVCGLSHLLHHLSLSVSVMKHSLGLVWSRHPSQMVL